MEAAADLQLEPERLRRLLAYWRSKLAGRPMPARADLDPMEVRDLLPYLTLLEVEPAPLRFRYRLVGSDTYRLREGLAARELTGRYVDEVDFHTSTTAAITAFIAAIVERQRPAYRRVPYALGSPRAGMHHMLGLPLSGDGRAVDMVLGGVVVTTQGVPLGQCQRALPV